MDGPANDNDPMFDYMDGEIEEYEHHAYNMMLNLEWLEERIPRLRDNPFWPDIIERFKREHGEFLPHHETGVC